MFRYPHLGEGIATEFSLQLFGGPRLDRHGVPVSLSPQELLCIALVGAFHDEGIGRDKMLDYLWPKGDQNTLQSRFRQLLHMVRTKLGNPDVIVSRQRRLFLNRQIVATDLAVFHDSLETGNFGLPMALLDQDFLPGVQGSDAHTLIHWLERMRVEYKALLRRALAAAVTKAEDQADFNAVAELGALQLQLDPDDEAALRRVLKGYGFSGRAHEGLAFLRTYQEHQGLAGHDPELDTATVELVAALSRTVTPASSEERAQTQEAMQVPSALGRRSTIDEILTFVQSPGSQRTLHVIRGAPGSGKSHLLRTLNAVFTTQGYTSLYVSVDRSTPSYPYMIVREICLALDRHLNPSAPISVSPLPQSTFPDPAIACHTLGHLLHSLLGMTKGTVIFCDDAHFLDSASLQTLRILMRRLDISGLHLILSACVSSSDSEIAHLPLPHDVPVREISLPALDASALADLALRASPELDGDSATYIAALSSGIPALAEALASHGVASDSDLDPLPYRVERFLHSCVERSPPYMPEVLSALSVPSYDWSIDDLADCFALQESALFETLRYASAIGAAKAIAPGLYRADGLFLAYGRTARLHSFSSARRKVAHFLEKRGAPPEALLDAWYNSECSKRVPRLSLLAATEASRRGEVLSSVKYLEKGLHCSRNEAERVRIRTRLGHALLAARQVEAAVPTLRRAASEALLMSAREASLRLSIEALDAEGHLEGVDPGEMAARLDEMVARCMANGAHNAAALGCDRALHYRNRSGDDAGAVSTLRLLEAIAQEITCEEGKVQCLASLSLWTYFGDSSRGLAAAREAVDISRSLDALELRLFALNRLLLVLLATGRLRTAEGRLVAQDAMSICEQQSDVLQRCHLLINMAVWEGDCGNWEEGILQLRALVPQIRNLEDIRPYVITLCNMGLLTLRAGDLVEAERLLRECAGLLPQWSSLEIEAQVTAGLGWIALGTGRLGLAKEFQKKLDSLTIPISTDVTTITLFRARLLRRVGRAEEAVALLSAAARRCWDSFPVHGIGLIAERKTLIPQKAQPDSWKKEAEAARELAQSLGLCEWSLRL